jgi:hypothetical protein
MNENRSAGKRNEQLEGSLLKCTPFASSPYDEANFLRLDKSKEKFNET